MPSWQEFENIVQNANPQEEFEALKSSACFIGKLVKARLDKNLTQAELASRSGLKQSAIARIENHGSLPRVDTLLRITEALEMELDFVPKNHQPEETLNRLVEQVKAMEFSITKLTGVINNFRKPVLYSKTEPRIVLGINSQEYKKMPITRITASGYCFTPLGLKGDNFFAEKSYQ